MVAESLMSHGIIAAVHESNQIETMARDYSRLVYRIAYSVLGNTADAEDTTQETFLRVLHYGKKTAAIRDPKAWIARIAWRMAVERRRQGVGAPSGTEIDIEKLLSPGSGTDQFLLEQERSELLDRLICALPDTLREPLVLSALEEMSPQDVAMVLGISEAAVRSRAFRARQILKERLLAANSPRK